MTPAKRTPDTTIEVFMVWNYPASASADSKKTNYRLFQPSEIAVYAVKNGALAIVLTDGSKMTFGPTWTWVILEAAQ